MKLARALPLLALSAPLLLQACSDDDGADTREAGSVVVIGSPPGGGGSVSAVGAGCVTKGATTKQPMASVQFELDEHTITPPEEITAGVNRVVAKNFGADPHELVITRAGSVEDLPVVDGAVDIAALADDVYRVQEFAGNTICQGTFDLPPGDYVVFSNVAGPDGNDFERGMAATFTVE